ncbi:hypothetical protein E4U42_007845 [Claviceps africana]|uniref:Uncharacterized protein n=1 Tax=Claviceps africana TaxID=83212 RepID=A0A8K0NNH2_9HYPO|nr:hypothetical protein E4U42_007845 [Claviceps africana]
MLFATEKLTEVTTTDDFAISVKRILRSVKSIDLTKAKVTPSSPTPQQDAAGEQCLLVVETMQNDAHPIHVLECRQLENGYVRINSFQYSKCVTPRSTKPGALRFVMPTDTCKGVRQDLRAALGKLARNKGLRRRLGVESVEVVRETPRDMEWIILLS